MLEAKYQIKFGNPISSETLIQTTPKYTESESVRLFVT